MPDGPTAGMRESTGRQHERARYRYRTEYDCAPRSGAHPAHMEPDPAAAGDHDDVVLRHFRQPHRQSYRRDRARHFLYRIHRAGSGDDERDPERLRQYLELVLRREVSALCRRDAGVADAELDDPHRLRDRRGDARFVGRGDCAGDFAVFYQNPLVPSVRHAQHVPARRSDLRPARLHQCDIRRASSTISRSFPRSS